MLRWRLNVDRGLGTTAGWLGTWENFPFMQFNLSCKSCNCEGRCCIVSWLSLNWCTENSATRSSWALVSSSISWMPLIRVSHGALSLRAKSPKGRTCSLPVSSHPQCASSNSSRWEWVCRWSSRMQRLRESTVHPCFMNSDFASASMWSLLPSRIDFATFTGLENLKKGSLLTKTYWCLSEKSSPLENVSWFDLFLLETNATGLLVLIRSWDELDIKFSRVEWSTCDRSAFTSRSWKYSGEASRERICSSSKSEFWSGVSMLSAEL